MTRVALDLNVAISGLLWSGTPARLIALAREGKLGLFTSAPLLDRMSEVMERPKFAPRLRQIGFTPGRVIEAYALGAHQVRPAPLPPLVTRDPEDDEVVRCAVAAAADSIVTGDHHLLDLRTAYGIPVLTAQKCRAAVEGSAAE